MSKPQGTERRRVARTPIATNCPAHFMHDKIEQVCYMENLSEFGAGFRIEGQKIGSALAPNKEIAYTVKTPYGESECRARTVWSSKKDSGYVWGVEFTKLSDDKKDPLRCLVDSPF